MINSKPNLYQKQIVLLAYRRPNLLQSSISYLKRIVESDDALGLLISIDGLASGASAEEGANRERCIEIANRATLDTDNVSLQVRKDNTGIASHVFDTLRAIGSYGASVVMLEEDQNISPKGIAFLFETVSRPAADGTQPLISVAHSTVLHFGNRGSASTTFQPRGRLTYFPEMWGFAMNAAMQRLVLEQQSSDINRDSIRGLLEEVFGDTRYVGQLVSRWHTVFERAKADGHADGIIQYCMWMNGISARVPLSGSYVLDFGRLERGGFSHRRSRPRSVHRLLPSGDDESPICQRCERWDAQRRWGIGPSRGLLWG